MRTLCGTILAAAVAALAADDGLAFEVQWNGRPLPVHPARVSKVPMNQVWDGYQRPVEQTETASFVSFDMAEAGELTVRPDASEAGGSAIALPLSYKPPIQRRGDVFAVRVERPRLFALVFGKSVLHVFANPPFAAPREADEIVFGPGEHHVGLVAPKSGQTVRIEEGAVVYGSIFVAHAENVRVVGRGIVDGSYLDRADRGSAVYRCAVAAGLPEGPYGAEMAVTTFTCAWSTNVLVEGVTFRNPPRWTMIVRAQSRNVAIDNVKIVGCWRYNSDGINACASENVTIRNSFVRAFDDCIVARGAYLDCGEGPTRNIRAENCVLWCDWGKNLEVWAGHKPCLIENVLFRDIACVHVDTIACDVTTWFGSSDTRIRNVSFENIELDFAMPRRAMHYQASPTDSRYKGGLRRGATALAVDCGKFGRYLGNQKFEPADDLSGFHVRYENIAFRGMTLLGDVPETVGYVDATKPPHAVDGLTLEGLPPQVKVEVRGNVSRRAPRAQ
ncbi:MAG: hypothetical protein IKE55_00300 [Kiritimatiellae bacterium]|nr:hypothetical protein [Kiritimatiellia bacterium]